MENSVDYVGRIGMEYKSATTMFVSKRNGTKELLQVDKITHRIEALLTCTRPCLEVDVKMLVQKVMNGTYDGVPTTDLDQLMAETAAHLLTTHRDYGVLATRVVISSLHKITTGRFGELTARLAGETMLGEAYVAFVDDQQSVIESAIDYTRDYDFDYFGTKTLEKSYLMRIGGTVVERPQDMFMRVACGIHVGDITAALETYRLLSEKWFIHASPTLFNAGTPDPQLSSCFLLTMKEDSVEGIFDTLKQCAQISKHAGGIGLSISNIRATGSHIHGTNGTSSGIIPMLRVFNTAARYVDQGGGKRKGAFAVYLEPWHADILAFLDLRKNNGVEETRARDLFLGLWIPDLFMERVAADGEWALFCPNVAKGLCDTWGEEFRQLYAKYECDPEVVHTRVRARVIWDAILESQTETGVPYMLYKDACNSKSNQQNLGTIRGSNLCTEIIQYSSAEETAVCNLASVALPRFVGSDGTFDFGRLRDICGVLVRNLNKIIDLNYYPVETARYSNLRNRPIGIGVQGLADVFAMLGHPYESAEARKLNVDIFETIYFAACSESMALARREGPYATFAGSPMSRGIFQFDMWDGTTVSDRWDWDALREQVRLHGVRNSLLVAPMPTASTAQILGNNECFEPFTSNIYVRRTLAGEFTCINRHLLAALADKGLWSPRMKNRIIAAQGSVQSIDEIPADLREVYKTVWEMRGRSIVDMAADRAPFIDQSQSLNVHMVDAGFSKLTAMHFHAWKRGLKTGMYYLRSQAASEAMPVTVCMRDADSGCVSCSG